MRKPSLQPLSLSIVLPCYDEEANVERTVREALDAGRSVASELEVVVVDDGSRDRTAEIVDALARRETAVRLVQNPTNVGYGGALRRGLLAARLPWVFYTDGDGQLDVGQIGLLLPSLHTHDIVSGYRIHRSDGALRSLNGRLWTGLTNAVLGLRLRDVNCAFKVYPRALFDHIEMSSDGALIDAEILSQAAMLGMSIAEVGVHHRARRAGRQTGGDPRVVARAFAELADLMIRRVTAPRAEVARIPSE